MDQSLFSIPIGNRPILFLFPHCHLAMITLHLTEEQAAIVHAALVAANALCRKRECHFLDMRESPKVGPVTRAEAWQTYNKWLQHENETAATMQQIQSQTSLNFTAWQVFSV